MMFAVGGDRLCGPLAFFGLVALLSSGALAGIEKINVQRHAQLLGSSECMNGPSFWCKNITNAAGCNAVKHCIQTTWATQTYLEDNDVICSICKTFVNGARAILPSHATAEAIKSVIDGFCGLIPLDNLRVVCGKLTNLITTLVDLLNSFADADVVCSLIGLCNNQDIDKLLLEYEKNIRSQLKLFPVTDLSLTSNKYSESSNDCEEMCTSFMTALESEITSEPLVGSIEVMLKSMCTKMPSNWKQECNNLIATQLNSIIKRFTVNVKPEDMCIFLGICGPFPPPPPQKVL